MVRIRGGSLVAGVTARARWVWRGLRRRGDVESEMSEEFRHHIELRTEDLMRRGVPAREAARRARVEFGHVEGLKEDARASMGLRGFDQLRFSWVDVKLGLRLLAKYPGLSVVSVVGMAVAIAIAAGGFGYIQAMVNPRLPLHEGERLVAIQNNDIRYPGNPDTQSMHDFLAWRDDLVTIRDVAALNPTSRTVVVPGSGAALVGVAEVTASAFTLARVAPALGRTLILEDERLGSPPVVVIAEEEWQRRFAGDLEIIGRPVRLGSAVHTVVGVMPAGFRFPVNHRYWVPLRLDPTAHPRGEGPQLYVFGRLADGVTMGEVRAELATLGARAAAAYPETHEHLRPEVVPYTYPFVGIDSPSMALLLRAVQLALSLLLVIVAVNVGALVYARTATRSGEIAVRSALGASRRRIIAQLFAEALVLSSVAAAIGLGIASAVLNSIQRFQEQSVDWQVPFWIDFRLSPPVVAYVAGLAILGGAIVGVAPALKATGPRIRIGLQQLSSRSSSMRLGRTWTGLIVAQVAIAVAMLPYAGPIATTSVARTTAAPGYPAHEVLRGALSIEQEEEPAVDDVAAYRAGIVATFRQRAAELLRRLEDEPGVTGVSFATGFPGWEGGGRMETESGSASWVRTSELGVDLLDVLGVGVLVGRGFTLTDTLDGSNVAIVNRTLADRLGAAGSGVLGRRVRFIRTNRSTGETEPGPWLEIVGVVPDFALQPDFDPPDGKLYRPARLPQAYVMDIAVRVTGATPAMFAGRLREITADVDPALQLHELRSAADAEEDVRKGLRLIAASALAVTLSVLLLSVAGIYAMMSFTVARRRREIGIRMALGAPRRRVLGGIFAKVSAQLGTGVLAGVLLAALLAVAMDRLAGGGPLEGRRLLLLPLVAGLMIVVGLLAALGPARQGLAVQPTEALREE